MGRLLRITVPAPARPLARMQTPLRTVVRAQIQLPVSTAIPPLSDRKSASSASWFAVQLSTACEMRTSSAISMGSTFKSRVSSLRLLLKPNQASARVMEPNTLRRGPTAI